MIILRDFLRYVNVKRMSNVQKKPGGRNVSTRCDKNLYFTLIVILTVFFVPFFKMMVALTVAVPAFTAVIVPFLLTVAMDFSDVA